MAGLSSLAVYEVTPFTAASPLLNWCWYGIDHILQPGDDIVFMAEELEKVFMQKIAQMPPEERPVSLKKGKRKGKKTEGKACFIC